MIRRRIVLAALLAALFALGWWVGRGSAGAGDLYANLDLFVEVLQRVEESYVDRVEPKTLVEGALKGMLRDLDPYSQYLDARGYDNLRVTTHGTYGGVGLVVSVRDHHPTVISPIEGGPAWSLGMRPGDVIVRIDGAPTAGLSVEEVAEKLRGPQGTHVRVSVRREGEESEIEYAIERRVIVTKSVPYAFVAEGHTGYLRLANFSESSGAEVRDAVQRLRREGATRLVLDLRSNPGGLLDQAVDVAEQFTKSNTLLVYTRGRVKGQDQRFYSSDARPVLDWPLVVLVDEGSASASEIVAGALQDLDRALVLGQTTFGKGLVQSVFPLRNRTVALKLTTSRYYTPSGRSIDRPRGQDSALAGREDLAPDEPDEDGEVVAPLARPARADTAPPPSFRTTAGRVVHGGGGIRPDVLMENDSLPPLTRRVESRGLAFRFANRWVNRHAGWKLGSSIEPAVWSEFTAFLGQERVEFTPAEVAAERRWLERALRRELARRLHGDAAAMRVALEGDPVFERALDVLSRARTPREVFAAMRVAPEPPARLAREPASAR
ncbi:MAG TPA: S41 family peptidase [Candidatus Limnocylindria bacterium]|nr:S41 family peptidase [Candidatus Limnocylindria bacterium]